MGRIAFFMQSANMVMMPLLEPEMQLSPPPTSLEPVVPLAKATPLVSSSHLLPAFDELARVIRERSAGRQIIFLPNPGNFGDGLIRYGAKRFLYDYRIPHTEIHLGKGSARYFLAPYLARRNRYLFIYSGGSAWGHNYRHAGDICAFISYFTDNLVVLPSTFYHSAPKVRGTLFRRDEFESEEACPRSLFCHDMALYLMAKGLKYDFGPPEIAVGYAYRRDRESSHRFEKAEDNIDISALGNHMSNGDDFLREIARYETIVTDRLHIGIGAAILGRRVKLYSGNDYKIRAIYHTSLTHIPNIEFLD